MLLARFPEPLQLGIFAINLAVAHGGLVEHRGSDEADRGAGEYAEAENQERSHVEPSPGTSCPVFHDVDSRTHATTGRAILSPPTLRRRQKVATPPRGARARIPLVPGPRGILPGGWDWGMPLDANYAIRGVNQSWVARLSTEISSRGDTGGLLSPYKQESSSSRVAIGITLPSIVLLLQRNDERYRRRIRINRRTGPSLAQGGPNAVREEPEQRSDPWGLRPRASEATASHCPCARRRLA
jgi:hypothetical protein